MVVDCNYKDMNLALDSTSNDFLKGRGWASSVSNGFQGHQDGFQIFMVVLLLALVSEGALQESFSLADWAFGGLKET